MIKDAVFHAFMIINVKIIMAVLSKHSLVSRSHLALIFLLHPSSRSVQLQIANDPLKNSPSSF
jgi:hypothetical protein